MTNIEPILIIILIIGVLGFGFVMNFLKTIYEVGEGGYKAYNEFNKAKEKVVKQSKDTVIEVMEDLAPTTESKEMVIRLNDTSEDIIELSETVNKVRTGKKVIDRVT